MFVNILPADRPGEKAFVSVEPYANYYSIDNRILTTPTGTGPRKFVFARQPGSRVLTLWGNIPVDDPGGGEGLAIDDPADFAAQLFQDMLEQRGITIYGKTRTRHTELANLENLSITAFASGGGRAINGNQPLVLGTHESQPLIDDLTVINKVSQNLHAELMLRLLGREKGTAGTVESGLEVERGFLTQVGIGKDEYAFYDGSGMSRLNLVSPDAVVKLLQYIDRQPWGSAFAGTLPVAGTDGSLIDRFKGTDADGRVKGKTGTLTHVTALAGYATTVSGERVAFSIFCNNHILQTRRAQELIDRIVVALVDDRAKK
jgi:D-alanyl-D-alanine carboxypeptidase/D-alanyl-D-alanine-endopeptidase (penicillin-binding protein 4)